jgi:hypothetical protein
VTAQNARASLAASISEKDFQQQVIELASLTGWLHYHTYDARRSPSGFPDLVLAHPDGLLVVAELKAMRGRETPEQARWLDAMNGAELHSYLWRPDDWGCIEQLLRMRLT